MGHETRNKLTDHWSEHDISEKDEFAILTNIINKEWSDLTVGQHKKLKNLKTQNLRDHMSEVELIFTALAEVSTRQIAKALSAEGLAQNKIAGQSGGAVAKKARIDLEKKTGQRERFFDGGFSRWNFSFFIFYSYLARGNFGSESFLVGRWSDWWSDWSFGDNFRRIAVCGNYCFGCFDPTGTTV